MTSSKIKQYPIKEKDAKNIVWTLKRPLLNTLRKILSKCSKEIQIRSKKRVREWVQKEGKVTSLKAKRFRRDVGGWKLTDVELEEKVLSWIQQRCLNILRISRKLIMVKAKSIYDEK